MATYKNLPGVNLELLDGQLRAKNTSDARRVLVIGRSETGPSNRLYTVYDTNKAASDFGASTPLIRKMSEALLGGATQVQLYRIGGKPAKLSNIFGEGTFIQTTEQSIRASEKLRVYIGPRPTNDGKACMIVFKGKDIVYSNVPGSEIDKGEIQVEGFDFDSTLKIGTPTEPVAFNAVIPTPKKLSHSYVGNAVLTDFVLPNATNTDEVTGVEVKVGGAVKTSTVDYTLVNEKANNRFVVRFNTPPLASEKIEVSFNLQPTGNEFVANAFSGNSFLTSFVLPNTKTTDQIELTKVTVAGVDKLPSDVTLEDELVGGTKQVTFLTPPDDQASIIVEYIVTRPKAVIPGTFEDGEDNINTTWKKYFELLHSGLWDLETINAFSVVTDAAIIDAPNIADGSTDEDRLEYVYVYEEEGELKYEWSDTKILYRKGSGTTQVASEADINGNGQPIVYRRYHEVSFAHLLANFAHTISENENFCLVSIGTSLPTSLTSFGVAKWLGSPATYDADGNILANGTGLLGLRNMTVRSDTRQGFYKTSSGFVDGGVVTDSNGAPVDIGKYLSVVPQVILTSASASAGTTSSITNGAGIYAGLLTTVQAGSSTTNAIVPYVQIPVDIKKIKLDQLAGAGYVMFKSTGGSTRVVSGELATNIDSDYDYVSTSIIIAETVNRVRNVCLPFIGRGLTSATIVSLDTAIESELQKLAESDVLVKYQHQVSQEQTVNGKGVLDVALTIVPPFELREVNASVKLSAEL